MPFQAERLPHISTIACGEQLRVLRRDEVAGHSFGDNLGVAADRRRNDRQADRHRFQDRQRDPFRLRRGDVEPRLGQQARDIGPLAEELDPVGDPQFAAQCFEPSALRTVADEPQPEIRHRLGHELRGSQQRREIFFRRERATEIATFASAGPV